MDENILCIAAARIGSFTKYVLICIYIIFSSENGNLFTTTTRREIQFPNLQSCNKLVLFKKEREDNIQIYKCMHFQGEGNCTQRFKDEKTRPPLWILILQPLLMTLSKCSLFNTEEKVAADVEDDSNEDKAKNYGNIVWFA